MSADTDSGEVVAEVGGLKRALSSVGNGALTFAGVGVFGGLYALYGFSLNAVGGSEFWGWIVIGISVCAMVLVFAELASKYPFAGSMYQWPTLVSGKRVGWWIGWMYAGAIFPLMTAYYASMPILIYGIFDIPAEQRDFTLYAGIITVCAIVSVLWNLVRIGILGRIAQWAMVLEIVVVFVVCLVTFVLGVKHFGNLTQAATTVTDAAGTASVVPLESFSQWIPLFLAAGIFNAIWVQYTFENGGTLGEETKDAERNAPKGVVGAFIFVIICGLLFYLTLTPSIPDMSNAMINYTPADDAILSVLPVAVYKLFLSAIAMGLLVATATMFTGGVRHIYGMARDGQLPFSRFFTKTIGDGSPWAATLLIGVFSLIPLFVFKTSTPAIVGGATAAMYMTYFLVLLVVFIHRLKGWPKVKPAFRLGSWGILVNLVAVVGVGLTLINLLWPRSGTNPTWNQATGGDIGILGNLPLAWLLIALPLIVGVIFYAFWNKRIHAHPMAIDAYKPQP